MSLNLHFLLTNLDIFRNNMGAFSDGLRDKLHQRAAGMENNYTGRWSTKMLIN